MSTDYKQSIEKYILAKITQVPKRYIIYISKTFDRTNSGRLSKYSHVLYVMRIT